MLPLWGVLAAALLGMMLFFTARQLLDANVYLQARAQLYGNDLKTCRRSHHWDLLELTRAQMELTCERPGKARGRILYVFGPDSKKVLVESVVDLVGAKFDRPSPSRLTEKDLQ